MKINNGNASASLLIKMLSERPSLIPVWDLDGVLVDASHRIRLKPCGALDLDHYRQNTTAEQVALDQSLPLLRVVHWLNEQQRPYYVATARVACEHTRNMLNSKQIKPLGIMARLGHEDRRGDAVLKADHFMAGFTPEQRASLILIDDLPSNCEGARACGMLSVQVVTDYGSVLMR